MWGSGDPAENEARGEPPTNTYLPGGAPIGGGRRLEGGGRKRRGGSTREPFNIVQAKKNKNGRKKSRPTKRVGMDGQCSFHL